MSAYNFQKQFVALIESGEKCQTIRTNRKDGRKPKVGETLYLYTGMRTKACRKIKEIVCKEVISIVIDYDSIFLNTWKLAYCEKNSLALADGFETYKEFQDFFEKTHGLPFHGNLIKW